MTVPTVGGSVSCWVSGTGNFIPGHLAPGGFANLALQSALDRRYDHAAADGAPRSLRPEEATGVGQIVTIVIELAAGAVRSGLKHNTRQTRSEAGTVSQSEFMPL
jgi:hypothetical protein